MLPQSVGSPMDSEASGPCEQSLPPDICLKSSPPTSAQPCHDSNNLSHMWLPNSASSDSAGENAMDIAEETVTSDHAIAQSDLLQSACISRSPDANNKDPSDHTGALPDLCGGVDSTRPFTFSSGFSASTTSKLSPDLSDSSDTRPSYSDCHQGAKPKVFKSHHSGRTRGSGSKSESSKCSGAIRRSNDSSLEHGKISNISLPTGSLVSHLESSSSSDILEHCDILTPSNLTNESELSSDVLETGDIAEPVHPSNSSSIAVDETGELSNSSSAPREDETQNAPASKILEEEGEDSKNMLEDSAGQADNIDLVDSEEACIPSLMEDYLLYDSRPISLVACGIWDCDSSSQNATECSDNSSSSSGLLIVRNNLHSASHPMFSRWPCEAYIPSHMLVDVAFNSHGSSLGISAVRVATFTFPPCMLLRLSSFLNSLIYTTTSFIFIIVIEWPLDKILLMSCTQATNNLSENWMLTSELSPLV